MVLDTENVEDHDQPVEDHLYYIDESAYEKAGQSFQHSVWRRLCWSGDCRTCKQFKAKPSIPVGASGTKSLYAAVRRCARQDDFILPNMSILEAIFRILLRNGNDPMRLTEIARSVEKEWVQVLAMKSVSLGMIQRLLENSNEYKLSRFEEPAE